MLSSYKALNCKQDDRHLQEAKLENTVHPYTEPFSVLYNHQATEKTLTKQKRYQQGKMGMWLWKTRLKQFS